MGRILSLVEFEAAYPDEDACWRKLVATRWPQGFRCPKCTSAKACFVGSRRVFQCGQCRYQCSAIVGTVMQDTKLPLRAWFLAMFLYATTKKSVSAAELQRKLGLGSYETAWMLHAKVQHAFLKINRKLRGLVEVDETYVGGVTPWQGGRGTGKAPVAMAVETRGEHAGRLAAQVLPDASGDSVRGFVQDHVQAGSSFAPGSIVKTDGWPGYHGLDECGYQHAPEVEGDPKRAMEILPLFHKAAGNLKRVLYGTHAGRVSRKHLPGYVAAFTFRYNHRGFLEKAFDCTVRRVVRATPLPYKMHIC